MKQNKDELMVTVTSVKNLFCVDGNTLACFDTAVTCFGTYLVL